MGRQRFRALFHLGEMGVSRPPCPPPCAQAVEMCGLLWEAFKRAGEPVSLVPEPHKAPLLRLTLMSCILFSWAP